VFVQGVDGLSRVLLGHWHCKEKETGKENQMERKGEELSKFRALIVV
jgi:hypothetical protein